MFDRQYVIERCNKIFLEHHGFEYKRAYSYPDDPCYVKRIPVYQWQNYICLTAEFKVFLISRIVRIDVYDGNTKSYYAGYYVRDWGDVSPITDVIDRAIAKEMKQLGIREVKNNEIGKDDTHQIFTKQRGEDSFKARKDGQRRLNRSQSSRNRQPQERRVQIDPARRRNAAARGV